MSTQKSLRLHYRFETPHPSLSYTSRLMRLLCSIVLILFSAVDRLGDQLSMSYAIASQFIGDNLPGLTTATPYQPPEEPLCSGTVSLCLQEYINNFAILVHGPPQIMLLAVYLHKDLIYEESIAIASVLAFQAACINGAELDTPETDCFSADGDASFSEEIFDIPMAEIEAVVQPDSVGNDIRRESVMMKWTPLAEPAA